MTLVVGADGLIGGALQRALQASGANVVGTSRRGGGGDLHLDLVSPEKFEMPRGVDVTVICAGVGDIAACARSPEETCRINVAGTARVAKRAMEEGSRVVVLSSSLVFDGQGTSPRTDEPLSPCCEYGRQKAVLESELGGENCAIVRLTKIVETLRPRFSSWLAEFKQGRPIRASAALCFSPVALDETVGALRGLVANFQPGVFHISGDESFTYHDAAVRLTEESGVSPDLALPDTSAGVGLFDPVPLTACLAPAAPANCSGWRFSPSSVTVTGFLRSL